MNNENKERFMMGMRAAFLFIGALLIVACSAGCANYAATASKPFYFFAAVANVGGWGWAYYKIIKALKADGKL